MNTPSKRAGALTPTLSSTALAGGTNINPMEMDLTMNSHIMPAPGAATHTLTVGEDRTRPLNPGEPQKFSTSLDGQPVVTRSTTPFFDSCRVLASWGMAGKVEFVDATTGARRMTMEIAQGAKLTVKEGPNGPRVRKADPESLAKAGLGDQSLPADTQAAIGNLEAAIAAIDGMTDEESNHLDGVA